MAWATAADVKAAWIGDDEPTDTALVQTWVGKAERLVRSAVPGIQARIDAGEPDLAENVADVVVDMVIRKFRNPEGLRTVSEATGPFSGTRTYGGSEPGALYITDDELAKISGGADGTPQVLAVDMIPRTSPFSPHYVGGVL